MAPVEYGVIDRGSVIVLRGRGLGDPDLLRPVLEAIVVDASLPPRFAMLVDARDVDPPPSSRQTREIGHLHWTLLGHRLLRTAFLTTDGLMYGIGRQIQGYGETPDSETRVFVDEAEAVRWVGEDATPSCDDAALPN